MEACSVRVYVGNLSYETTQDELRSLFAVLPVATVVHNDFIAILCQVDRDRPADSRTGACHQDTVC